MKIKVKIPKLGLTIETGKLTEWSRQVGDRVQAGEVLGQIEADKAVYDIEAPVAGQLIELLQPADPDIDLPVGTPIAVIETSEPIAAGRSTP